MIAIRTWIATTACALALSACSMLVGHREEFTLYSPTYAGTARAASTASHPWQLSLAVPQAISPLSGSRIVVLPQPGVLEFYKGARWRDDVPILLQALLVRAFQDSASLAGVEASASAGGRSDFVLQSDLQEFQAEYRGARVPTVTIRLAAQLTVGASGRVVRRRVFSVEQPCDGSDLPRVFAAFQTALRQLLDEIVSWTVESGEASLRER